MDPQILYEDMQDLDQFQEKNPDIKLQIKFDQKQNFWQGKLEFDNEIYFFRIFYNYLYPFLPPHLFCYTDEGYNEVWLDAKWYGHAFPDKHLCLFTRDSGESGWKHSYRLGEVLKSFKSLINQTNNKKLSFHHRSKKYSIGDYALSSDVYLDDKLYLQIMQDHSKKKCLFGILTPLSNNPFDLKLPLFVIIEEGSNDYNYLTQKLQFSTKFFNMEYSFVLESKYKKIKAALVNWDKLNSRLQSSGITLHNIPHLIGNRDYPKSPAILLLLPRTSKNPEYLLIPQKVGFFEAIYLRQNDYLKEAHNILDTRRICIIGLGSVGSKIADELARNGIRHFFLFDSDVLKPENVLRGQEFLNSVGYPKAKVYHNHLKKINPLIEVQWFLGSPLHPQCRSQFLEILKTSHLVICAIDSEEDEVQIQKLCLESKTPAIYTVCLDSGHYGRVYRVIPGETACAECIRIQSLRDPITFPILEQDINISNGKDVNGSIDSEKSSFPPYPYENPGTPGINIDIWEVALKTVRLSLQTLARNTDLEKIIPDINVDHFLMSNRRGWIFDEPYQIRYLAFSRLKECPVCGQTSKGKLKSLKKQQEEYKTLAKKYLI